MEEVQPIVTELFSKFLATLLLRIGASTNIESSCIAYVVRVCVVCVFVCVCVCVVCVCVCCVCVCVCVCVCCVCVCVLCVQCISTADYIIVQNICSLAVEAFKQFLTLTKSDILLKTLNLYSAWSLLEKEDTFPHGILHVTR